MKIRELLAEVLIRLNDHSGGVVWGVIELDCIIQRRVIYINRVDKIIKTHSSTIQQYCKLLWLRYSGLSRN